MLNLCRSSLQVQRMRPSHGRCHSQVAFTARPSLSSKHSHLHHTMAPTKRKAPSSPVSSSSSKKIKADFSDRTRYKESSTQIKHGVVMRPFYPPEMTDERARKYNTNEIERPIETLQKALSDTATRREQINKTLKTGDGCVMFWFKNDLRTSDNKGLHLASELAKSKGVPLICLYVISPQDWEAHITAAVRVDFILRTLEVLRGDLAELDIPLYLETVEKRKALPGRLLDLCKLWDVKSVWCNMEYEVDELRREAQLCRDLAEEGIALQVEHDTCVVEPGVLKAGTGGQISVYSPWHRKWIAHLNAHQKNLQEYPRPARNLSTARQKYSHLFDSTIPPAPANKQLTPEEQTRFHSMWPAGEHEALLRLEKFLSQKIKTYHSNRNLPAGNGTAVISVHLSSGTLSARTVVRLAQAAAPTKSLVDDRTKGHPMWIAEVAWRDFYKHVLVHWPYVCMNKPFKPEYTNIRWEDNDQHFRAWCEGRTGYPLVDAAMRQMNTTGWMHNRCRMVVASFLAKDLLIDWRRGERYFMERLIDGDFASNNGGWGFSASTGVDPQPYFRIFNPVLQGEKFDPEGEYVRRWVGELEGVEAKKVHDPYGRGVGAVVEKRGYPRMIVEHKMARARALERYKEGVGKEKA